MTGLPESAYQRAGDAVVASDERSYRALARVALDASGLAELHDRIRELHTPVTEEAESWADGDEDQQREHAKRYSDCTTCAGHTYEVQVCSECGYSNDGESVYYRSWPCPTLRALGGES